MAEKFYRHGVRLIKVASYYNTVEDDIIPTQKAMLLDSLLDFEDHLPTSEGKSKNNVSWNNARECSEFVENIQKAAETLAAQNRKLKKLHSAFGDEIVALMNIDLLRKRDKWELQWGRIRDRMLRLATKYPKERMAKWQTHWDHQLFKTLEISYQRGLESLTELLPEIKAELVYAGGRLRFKPPLEDIKVTYFQELRRFLGFPASFEGFGDNTKLFQKLGDRNGERMQSLYITSKKFFARLYELSISLKPWVALGSLKSLEEFVKKEISSLEEYENNLKMVKKRVKQAEKLPDFYKIECVSISAGPFKSAVDDQLNQLNNQLINCLKNDLNENLQEIENFLQEATEMLQTIPASIEEIGEAKKEWNRFAEEKKNFKAKLKICDNQQKLLLSAAGNRANLGDIRQRLAGIPDVWQIFETNMEKFNGMIEEQREGLKAQVDGAVESCREELKKLRARWDALKPKAPEVWNAQALEEIFKSLDQWKSDVNELSSLCENLRENCEHFGMAIPTFDGMDELNDDINKSVEDWQLLQKYMEELAVFGEEKWLTFRTKLYQLSDFVTKWMQEIQEPRSEKGKRKGKSKSDNADEKEKSVVKQHIREELHKLQKAVPALKNCKGDVPFNDEHWRQLFTKLGMDKKLRLDTLTCGHFLDVLGNVVKYDRFCRDLTARATGEVRLREAMVELRDWAAVTEFNLFEHEELGRVTWLISEWKDLFTALGDNQSLLGSLKESPYFKPFAAEANKFEEDFSNLDFYLHTLNQIQRKWLYLEPIFIRGALPQEQERFNRVDEVFRATAEKIQKDPHVIKLCDPDLHNGIRKNLEMCLDQLQRCQKALTDFLDEKRSLMPRFYFIGDDDLLEILGQAQNAEVIQEHLKKLFQGIHTVNFSADKTSIVGMNSSKKEAVPFHNEVKLNDNVEEWLTSVVGEMKHTLKQDLVKCNDIAEGPQLTDFCSQILCLDEQVRFTANCEKAIQEGTMAALGEKCRKTLKSYTSKDYSKQKLLMLKVMSLLIDLMHMIDVVDFLVKEGTSDLADWSWQKQLRFYINKSGFCVSRMVDAELNYTYEYQGNAGKLVHTPLTDKCYLTLTQGMHQGYGGNPYGPAGTGKTESVKMLGATLGRQVLVFNCDEGIDFKSMGRIITGLVKCGAWGCFDEFNRLKADQLSAVSQQIQVVQDAIKYKNPDCVLMGNDIKVDFNAAIFVTMNPAGKKYGGRSKLPDNLKALFRPVAMSRPDNDQIAEVMLYANGFQAAKKLSTKVVSVFSLSKELLSPQQHYDWGLRALKAILVTGGKLIVDRKANNLEVNDVIEADLLVKSLRVNTLSKLTFADAQRFVGLCTDIFPEVDAKDIEIPTLQQAIKEVMESKQFNLIFDEVQMKKMLQLKESLEQRMGCVVVGPSGCGKTVVWSVLAEALRKTGQPLKTYVMNPKAMPRSQLLGFMDMDTREWNDGVLTDASKKVVKEDLSVKSWIICDGDVDPEWIESLNSVLDDNHLLTLPNGERINFGPNVNFLFETHDLSFASPATISRMGMIFLSEKDVDVQKTLSKWMENLPAETRPLVTGWVDDYFKRALTWVLKKKKPVVDTTLVGTVLNGLSKLRHCKTKAEFTVNLIQGLGGNLDMELREEFAKIVFGWTQEFPADPLKPLDSQSVDGRIQNYVPLGPATEPTRANLESGLVVQTISFQRNLSVVKNWFEEGQPFIVVGPEGCGKSTMLNYLFRQRKGTSIATLNCNSQTTADNVIQKIQEVCALFSSPTGRVYKPREGDRAVLFLKDINLPKPDKYRTCMLVAFLQQLLTFNGFYDANLEFIKIEKVQIICSMNPPTTVGRHPLSTRFTAIVRVTFMDYPTKDELVEIYEVFVTAALSEATLKDKEWSNTKKMRRLAEGMVEIFVQFKNKFSVDDRRHYLVTPRELSKWVLGLFRYNLEEESFLEVVTYEAERLFRDRLVDAQTQQQYDTMANNIIRTVWSDKPAQHDFFFTTVGMMAEIPPEQRAIIKNKIMSKMNFEDFKGLIKQGLIAYEREVKELHILLFSEILEHMAVVDRVLSSPAGSLLLAGRAGVGRRSAVCLVANMHGMSTVTPFVTRDYTKKKFFNDLKNCFEIAGVEGRHVVLYIEDHNMHYDFVLEAVNSILSSGDVPGLYTQEELAPTLEPLKDVMEEEGAFNFRSPYEFFISRVVRNLHVCLGMDPTNDQFLKRCQSNPAITTACEIVWMGSWRHDSMMEIPDLLLPTLMAEANDERLPQFVVDIYETCQFVKENSIFDSPELTSTPRDLIAFLNCYRHLYSLKRDNLLNNAKRMEGGLGKLQEAGVTVDELTQDAIAKRAVLEEKQAAADKAMVEIEKALAGASGRRKDVKILSEKLATEEGKLTGQKEEIENELAEVKPLLLQAKKAVDGIKPAHLNEIKSLKTPPEAIADVLSGVLTLLGQKDLSWKAMKNFLGQRGVKEKILAFDAGGISKKLLNKVNKLLKKKGANFEQERIQKVSKAAAPMAMWVKSSCRYAVVMERIEPLNRQLADANAQLDGARKQLADNQAELKVIDDRVAKLKKEFAEMTREAESLKVGLKQTEAIVKKAQDLLDKLGGERTRWEKTVDILRKAVQTLPVKILMAAAYTTFVGKASEDVRAHAVLKWRKLTETEEFNYLSLLSSESQLLSFKKAGLPSDSLSQENSIIILNSTFRFSFIIDPSSSATHWLTNHLSESAGALEVVTAADPRFQNKTELAVRFGKTLLMLEVDGVEPMLVPLVRKDFSMQGPRTVVQLGDKSIDYNENFQLYLVTRNPRPYLPPDVKAIITEVNFSVTRAGLEGQLLGVTIQHENPNVEKEKSAMLQKEESYKIQLAELEDNLLKALSESKGNLLENEELIATLTKTKVASTEITEALEKALIANKELDNERNVYKPFAASATSLYFVLSKLQNVNNMYQFALSSFMTLFTRALEAPMDFKSVEDRLGKLTYDLEKRTLFYVGYGLFKADRLMWAVHLIHGMREDEFQENEWDYFVGDIVDVDKGPCDKLPKFAEEEQGSLFRVMSKTFPEMVEKLKFGDKQWNKWATNPQCESAFPKKMRKKTSSFFRLMTIQCLRPDRLQRAIECFACEVLQLDSVAPPPMNLKRVYEEESTSQTPILMIVTTGMDPSKSLGEVAVEVVGAENYNELPMGGGQQEIAEKMLMDAREKGHWLCLKNLHLVVSWLPQLEKQLSIGEPHKDFRLWLTTEAHAEFPAILLQQSFKITYESPPGIKKNLQSTFENWSPEFFEKGKSIARSRILFLLAWFHAVIQERRNFIPQGWSEFYEFSPSDLRVAANLVDAFTADGKKLQWTLLHGMLENALYGGRVSNPNDLRVMQAYQRQYFNDTMIQTGQLSAKAIMPNSYKIEDFVNFVKTLPDSDNPDIFGLAANIERAQAKVNSDLLIRQLKSLEVSASGDAGFDREVWRQVLGPSINAWILLAESDPAALETREESEIDGTAAPTVQFVEMEYDNACKIVTMVNEDIMALKAVIDGTGSLTPQIQANASLMMIGWVPTKWEKMWEGPEMPIDWLRAVLNRKIALKNWVANASSGGMLRNALKLSELLQPGTFLNAVRQETARVTKLPLDSLIQFSAWDRQLLEGFPIIVELKGLYIQGAGFGSKGNLQEVGSSDREMISVSSVFVAYGSPESPPLYADSAAMSIPIYYNPTRERVLTSVMVPIQTQAQRWIKSGTALFMDIV
jgi:dynein heavy chain 2